MASESPLLTPPDPSEPSVELVAFPSPPVRKLRRPGPSSAEYFLGLFVLGHLAFLCLSNFAGTVDSAQSHARHIPEGWKKKINRWAPWFLDKESRFSDAVKTITGVTGRWSDLTFQDQAWSLFAPDVARVVTFVAVELRWDDLEASTSGNREAQEMPYVPEMLLSMNEPEDPARFLHWGGFRLRKYESNLDVALTSHYSDKPETIAADWSESIKDHLSANWDNIHAYFVCRYRAFQEEHPGRPMPRQMILYVHRYDIPAPDKFSTEWYRPCILPIARWKPGHPGKSPYRQMDRFVPGIYDVLCSDIPGLRKNVSPGALALMSYWPQFASPLGFASAPAYHGVFTSGQFKPLD